MIPPKFQQLGLPDNSVVEQLIYSEPAQVLVARVRNENDLKPRYRFFSRYTSDTRYQALVDDIETNQSLVDPIPCPQNPFLYFNRVRWDDDGGFFEGVFRVDLTSRAVEAIPKVDDVEYISRLLSMSPDGTHLIVVSANRDSPGLVFSFRYYLASLDVMTGRINTITELEGVFI